MENIPDKKFSLSSIYRGLGLGTHKVILTSVSDANGCQRLLTKDDTVYIHVNDVPYATPLSPRIDYCVGERIGFSLSGVAPLILPMNLTVSVKLFLLLLHSPD